MKLSNKNQTITLPDQVTLAALVTSNYDFTVQWSKVSGPGSVTFSDTSKTITDVSFSESGDYILRITADDGEFSRYQDVNINVLPEPFKLDVKKSGTGNVMITFIISDDGKIVVKNIKTDNEELASYVRETLSNINCSNLFGNYNQHYRINFRFKLT